jgi:DnaJ-class molecular chaperone
MAKRDYYDVLGVSRSAGADEIRKAHRKLVRQHHPDVNKGNPGAEAKFREVQEAYDILSDAQKRQRYDQFGHAGVDAAAARAAAAAAGAGGADPFDQFRRAAQGRGPQRSWQAGPNVSVEDFDIGDLGDMFEQFFGGRGGNVGGMGGRGRGGGRGRARPQPQQQEQAPDIEHPVTMSFEQAARGTTIKLQIDRDGKLETIDIKVPPGVKEGSRVRIRGRGQQGDGRAGDLYIITHVSPHPYFRRDDLDIHLDLPISMYEALLGTKVEVPTLDGPVTLTIPPGTSSGAKLRIRGRGIERGDKKGDEIVVMKVIVPKELDAEDKKAIEAMARKHPVGARADIRW